MTFELDPVTHTPIRLASKSDFDAFVDAIVTDLEDDGAHSHVDPPVLRCRATSTFGVCTEECSVHVGRPDGIREHIKLRATAAAVRYPDGWKWIHWHMSVAAPIEVSTADDARVPGN